MINDAPTIGQRDGFFDSGAGAGNGAGNGISQDSDSAGLFVATTHLYKSVHALVLIPSMH